MLGVELAGVLLWMIWILLVGDHVCRSSQWNINENRWLLNPLCCCDLPEDYQTGSAQVYRTHCDAVTCHSLSKLAHCRWTYNTGWRTEQNFGQHRSICSKMFWLTDWTLWLRLPKTVESALPFLWLYHRLIWNYEFQKISTLEKKIILFILVMSLIFLISWRHWNN